MLNIAKNGIKPAWSARITVLDCQISGAQDTGGWGYGFYTYASSQLLYRRCVADSLRHNFTHEYAMSNMVVASRCSSTKGSGMTTPEGDDTHFAYSQRLLWDMHSQANISIQAENRETQSSGAYQTFGGGVVWNHSGSNANPYGYWQAGTVQLSPATVTTSSDAFVIGPSGGATIYDNSQDLTATYVYGTVMSGTAPQVGPRGKVAYEGIDKASLSPASLFEGQLITRLGALPPDVAPGACDPPQRPVPPLAPRPAARWAAPPAPRPPGPAPVPPPARTARPQAAQSPRR